MLHRLLSCRPCRVLLVFCSTLTLLTGCATGVYEEQFERSLRGKADEARFAVLHPEHFAITQDSALSIRIPDIFPKAAMTEGTHPPEVAKPPFMLDYPGYRFSYEGTPSGEGAESLPYYMYLGAVEKQAAAVNILPDEALTRAQAVDANAAWTDVTATTPDGKQLAFRKLRAAGNMLFRDQQTSGVFEMYMFDGGGYRLFVGFRWPDKVGTQLNLPNLVELSLGTLQVQEPSGQPAA